MNWAYIWAGVSMLLAAALIKKDFEDRSVAEIIQQILEGDDQLLAELREGWRMRR